MIISMKSCKTISHKLWIHKGDAMENYIIFLFAIHIS